MQAEEWAAKLPEGLLTPEEQEQVVGADSHILAQLLAAHIPATAEKGLQVLSLDSLHLLLFLIAGRLISSTILAQNIPSPTASCSGSIYGFFEFAMVELILWQECPATHFSHWQWMRGT